MAMKLVKKTVDYCIYQRGDNRYAVKGADKIPINGDEKARILVAEELIKVTLPAEPVAEEPAEESAAEPVAEDTSEAVAEEPVQEAAEDEAPAAEEAPAEEAAEEEDK